MQYMTLRMVQEHMPLYVVNYFDASVVPSESAFGDRYLGRNGIKAEEATATVPQDDYIASLTLTLAGSNKDITPLNVYLSRGFLTNPETCIQAMNLLTYEKQVTI